jgi:hypothetical protein
MLVRIVEVSECRTGADDFVCYFYLDDQHKHFMYLSILSV